MAACSSSVPAATVGQKVAAAIAAKEGIATPSVSCPRALQAKVGDSENCSMTLSGGTAQYAVGVKVTDSV